MYKDTIDYIKREVTIRPKIAIILGSGLGNFADQIENPIAISYESIPGFPVSTVEGHEGQLVFGEIAGINIVAMQGRFHYYEGYPIEKVVYPVRVLGLLGIDYLIVTNAAGGVNRNFKPGDLMIIEDHINFSGVNPLLGPNNDKLGPRFLDLSFAYNRQLISYAQQEADNIGVDIQKGCYMWFTGPNYETPAEVKMARTMGADAVGMSTVPEVIIANHMNIKILGISCITNMAAGIMDEPLGHKDVVAVSERITDKLQQLVTGVIKRIGEL